MTEKMTSFLSRTKYNAKYLVAAGATGTLIAGSALPVFASKPTTTKKSNEATTTTEVTADAIVGKVVEVVCDIARYIGIVLLAWSVVQLILAFKNEDADSKSRAMMLIVVSIVLITIKAFVKLIVNTAAPNTLT